MLEVDTSSSFVANSPARVSSVARVSNFADSVDDRLPLPPVLTLSTDTFTRPFSSKGKINSFFEITLSISSIFE